MTPSPVDEEEGYAYILPNYVPPRPVDVLKVRLGKNLKYQLVTPSISNGVQVSTSIITNLQKMGFVDHDLRKFPELEMNRYMTTVREIEDGPIHVVPMEWERGLDKA